MLIPILLARYSQRKDQMNMKMMAMMILTMQRPRNTARMRKVSITVSQKKNSTRNLMRRWRPLLRRSQCRLR